MFRYRLLITTAAILAIAASSPAAAQPVEHEPPADKRRTESSKQSTPTQTPWRIRREVPRDPYIPVPRATSPRSPGIPRDRGGFVSIQVNVDSEYNNILGDAANEPSIAVDPTDPNRMAIGWRQFDSITSDFRQAGWGYTTDGGQTWAFPGVLEPGVFRSDPVLDFDIHGNFYYNSLSYDPVGDFWCHVFRSTDGGMSWEEPGIYAFGGDKQWMAIDRTGGIGQGAIYSYWTQVYSHCSGQFTRSYDGGQSFVDCTGIPDSPQWGTMDVGPDGELYTAGRGFKVAKSTTMQDSSLPAQWDFSTNVSLDGDLVYSAGPNPAGLLGQTQIAVDSSTGATRGNVYLLASVGRYSTSDPLDVMFARSSDGGLTWSSPVRVNDDPAGNGAWQWFGTMSVGPTGRIDVIWLDTRNNPGTYDSELYYSFSDDAGETWSPNRVMSDSFDPHEGWPQQNKMGDYFDMVSDADGAHLAWAATFNGEQDVYYTRVRPAIAIGLPNGVPSLLIPGEPTDITVRISEGGENILPGSATLHYRFDAGVFQAAPLAAQGGELFVATIPAAGCGDAPEFYFSVEGDQSGVVSLPPDAPVNVYTATVGEVVVVMHDDFEIDQDWTAENLGASSGDWQRGIPVNDPGWAFDPVADSDGSGKCYLTENTIGNSDVDDGAVRLTSPAIDMTAGGIVIAYDYFLRLTDTTGGVDRILVEINTTAGAGVWTEIARHDTDGGLGWRHHEISEAELGALGVVLSYATMLRFTTNDAEPQSVNESGLDAFLVSSLQCGGTTPCPTLLGDTNGDGVLSGLDIAGFVEAYLGVFNACADMNGDGVIDSADEMLFVQAIIDPTP